VSLFEIGHILVVLNNRNMVIGSRVEALSLFRTGCCVEAEKCGSVVGRMEILGGRRMGGGVLWLAPGRSIARAEGLVVSQLRLKIRDCQSNYCCLQSPQQQFAVSVTREQLHRQ
jgi:hypothetical protein